MSSTPNCPFQSTMNSFLQSPSSRPSRPRTSSPSRAFGECVCLSLATGILERERTVSLRAQLHAQSPTPSAHKSRHLVRRHCRPRSRSEREARVFQLTHRLALARAAGELWFVFVGMKKFVLSCVQRSSSCYLRAAFRPVYVSASHFLSLSSQRTAPSPASSLHVHISVVHRAVG